MKLYIGNLPNSITEQELQDLFTPFGAILSVNVIKDKFTGLPRGFAFIEMEQGEAAQAAIAQLDGKEVKGRRMKVSEAQPRPERPAGNRFDNNRSGNGYGSRPSGNRPPSRGGGRSSFDSNQNRPAW